MEQFGICRLALTPLRDQPSDRSEMISQLLFGEHYQVMATSDDGTWLQVVSNFDQYQGWIDHKQHHSISEAYFQEINRSNYQITTDVSAEAIINGEQLHLAMGSVLPMVAGELFSSTGLLKFHGNSKSLSKKLDFAETQAMALKYLNAPYLWGGRSPWGIDCSGFVQQVFRIAGYALPRDSVQQVHCGSPVDHIKQAQAGDLAFFASTSGKIDHVGIILGDNQIIHASGKVRIDELREEGIWDGQQITHHMKTVRRVLK